MIKLRSHTACLVGMTLQRAKVLAVSSGWGGGGGAGARADRSSTA